MDLSKARCMQSAQRVFFVVRRGTTWLFRVTWSFSRWDVDAVAHQHAIARAKDPYYARHRQAESPSPLLSGPASGKSR